MTDFNTLYTNNSQFDDKSSKIPARNGQNHHTRSYENIETVNPNNLDISK